MSHGCLGLYSSNGTPQAAHEIPDGATNIRGRTRSVVPTLDIVRPDLIEQFTTKTAQLEVLGNSRKQTFEFNGVSPGRDNPRITGFHLPSRSQRPEEMVVSGCPEVDHAIRIIDSGS